MNEIAKIFKSVEYFQPTSFVTGFLAGVAFCVVILFIADVIKTLNNK